MTEMAGTAVGEPTPMTEMAGTAVGEPEAVGASVGAGATLPGGLVSVGLAVAVASWLDASEGEIVCVELKPVPERTNAPRALLWVSMKAAVGPARISVLARMWMSAASGCPSVVNQIQTGPSISIPAGTKHWSAGNAIDWGWPPMSIWQNAPVVELRAGELNSSFVPTATVPVLVIASGGFAGGRPSSVAGSQPDTKAPAIARTSDGVNATSNACGIGVAPAMMLRNV